MKLQPIVDTLRTATFLDAQKNLQADDVYDELRRLRQKFEREMRSIRKSNEGLQSGNTFFVEGEKPFRMLSNRFQISGSEIFCCAKTIEQVKSIHDGFVATSLTLQLSFNEGIPEQAPPTITAFFPDGKLDSRTGKTVVDNVNTLKITLSDGKAEEVKIEGAEAWKFLDETRIPEIVILEIGKAHAGYLEKTKMQGKAQPIRQDGGKQAPKNLQGRERA